jgi:hypothetical protein
VHLAPLPSGHTATVDLDEAIATVRRTFNVNGPVVYVDHGQSAEPAWLLIVKVEDMPPMPVGPACPSPPNGCYQHWAVNDYVVALISDETGEVAGGFTTMREVPVPSHAG